MQIFMCILQVILMSYEDLIVGVLCLLKAMKVQVGPYH